MPQPRRLPFLYEGEVTNRKDPDGLGRVKIRIAGLVEPETPNWAFPVGVSGGGFAQHGHFEPPAVGANVDVFFKHGEIDHPRYLAGPWGDPDGVSDVPTNGAIDDDSGEPDKRQNAVTEDEAWRIERDSRNGSGRKHRYLIRHKDSSLAVLIDADADKVYLVRESATQALVRGTEYRAAEVAFLTDLVAAIVPLAAALQAFKLDSGFNAAFAALAGTLDSAGTALTTALATLSSPDMKDDSSAYLSEKAFTE